MSNLYSITRDDLVPALIRESDFRRMTEDPQDGAPALALADVAGAAADEFNAAMGAVPPAGHAVIALARPMVARLVVYRLLARMAHQMDGKVPEHVAADAKAALAWARDTGARMLAESGAQVPSTGGGAQFTAPAGAFGMGDLDKV